MGVVIYCLLQVLKLLCFLLCVLIVVVPTIILLAKIVRHKEDIIIDNRRLNIIIIIAEIINILISISIAISGTFMLFVTFYRELAYLLFGIFPSQGYYEFNYYVTRQDIIELTMSYLISIIITEVINYLLNKFGECEY